MPRAPRILLCLACLASTAAVEGRIHSPRVVSPHRADGYSMRTFRQFHRWRDLEGDALAWAVFEYLTDRETGLYPMGAGAWEGSDDLYEYGLVRDPVKLLNVYSMGYCDVLGPIMAGMWEDMGLGPARTVNLPEWGHVASEVFYGGAWHYLDLDVRAAFRRAGGSLASLEEARADPALFVPSGPRFFPLDDVERTRRIYQTTEVHHRQGVHVSGHTMDYVLRAGESFTRWWQPQDGRWSLHRSHLEGPVRRLLEAPPRGPKSKHPSFTVHTHGNGRFLYRPDLSDRARDFEDGYYDSTNVRPGPNGLTLAEPGRGFAVFEVRTPYVIVPLVGELASRDDDRDASVVSIDGVAASASISLDGGKSWSPLGAAAGSARWDLTPRVAGRYGYLLRIDLEGRPGESLVRSLAIDTWVQLHPAALPALRRGANRLELRAGDHYGLATRVIAVEPDAGRPESLLPHLVSPPADYDPARRTSRIRGSLTAVIEAPPATRIAWLSAGASFAVLQGEAAPRTRNGIEISLGKPEGFHSIYRSEVPPGNSHWHSNAAREELFREPVEKVLVRYTGDPAVNNIRLFAHCVERREFPPTPVRVTHVFTDGSARRTESFSLAGPGSYTVDCRDEPRDESIEIAVPSTGASRP